MESKVLDEIVGSWVAMREDKDWIIFTQDDMKALILEQIDELAKEVYEYAEDCMPIYK